MQVGRQRAQVRQAQDLVRWSSGAPAFLPPSSSSGGLNFHNFYAGLTRMRSGTSAWPTHVRRCTRFAVVAFALPRRSFSSPLCACIYRAHGTVYYFACISTVGRCRGPCILPRLHQVLASSACYYWACVCSNIVMSIRPLVFCNVTA